MASADTLLDNIGPAPLETGHSVPRFPFLVQGDRTTRIQPRHYVQLASAYEPGVPGVDRDLSPPSAADDPRLYDPTAFLLHETDPAPMGLAHVVRFTRTFSRIPPTIHEPASRLFDRPVLHGIKSGSTYAVSFDEGDSSHLFSTRQTVTAISSLTLGETDVDVAAEAFGTLPASTFAIVDSADGTTSPVMTTAAATMQSAIASACGALDSVAVSSAPGSLTISWVGIVKSIGTSATGVTMSGGAGLNGSVTFTAARATVTDTQAPDPDGSVRTLSVATHGGAAGDKVALWNGDTLIGTTQVVTAASGTFTIPLKALPGEDDKVTTIAFAKDAGDRVANGPIDCSARLVRRFYLPGITTGIASMADIPTFTPVTAPLSWLGALVAYLASPSSATYAVVETAALSRWENSPILEKDVVEIQMADAVQTLAEAG